MNAADAHRVGSSLKLICLQEIQVLVRLEAGYNAPPSRKVRIGFNYHGVEYVLKGTS